MADSSDPVVPALSDAEWVEFGESKPFFDKLAAGGRPFGPNRRFTEEQKLHALAALSLHRLPIGFTHAELDSVDSAAQLYERRRGPGDMALGSALRTLHQKIEALLPPRGVKIVSAD